MYNQKQKEDFLEFYKSLKSGKQSMIDRAVVVLNRIEKYEHKWGMDICFQTDIEEVQKVVDEVAYASSAPTSGQLLVLRTYCEWCLENVPGSSDNLIKIKKASDTEFRNKYFGNPLQLQMHLNSVFDPESEQNVHNIYRAFAWLAFMGFTETEAFLITCDDVDIEKMVITHDDVQANIYSESKPAIENCKVLQYFKFTNSNYGEPTINRNRMGGNLLLRGIKAQPGRFINSEFSRYQTHAMRDGKIQRQFSYNNIWKSGIFYLALQRELINTDIKPNFKAIAIRQWLHSQSKKSSGGEATFDPNNPAHVSRIEIIAATLQRDYKRWKSVYYKQ